MFAILLALILRPVGFSYRSKINNPTWRKTWDWCLFAGGAIPALILGVAVGNVLQGVPFYFNDEMRVFYDGTTLFELLNPFAILSGLISVAMLLMHGAGWLAIKTEGEIETRARKIGGVAAIATAALYILAGIWLYMGVKGYALTTGGTDGPSNPLLKTVESGIAGQWYVNYGKAPVLWIVPLLGIVGAIVSARMLKAKNSGLLAWVASSCSIAGIITSVGVSMFPFILPSTKNATASLTVWDSSSSHMILFIMLVVAAIFVPIVLAYTGYVFRVLRGKVTQESVDDDKTFSY